MAYLTGVSGLHFVDGKHILFVGQLVRYPERRPCTPL
jgi:hypothetical protein